MNIPVTTSEYVCEHKIHHPRYESTIKPTNAVSVGFSHSVFPHCPLLLPREQVAFGTNR